MSKIREKIKFKDKLKIYFDNDIVSNILGIENPEYVHTINTLNLLEKNTIQRLWDFFEKGKIIIVTSAETRRELERHPESFKDQEVKRLEYYSKIHRIPVTSGGKYGQYRYREIKYGVSLNIRDVIQIIPEHPGKEMDVKHVVNVVDDSSTRYFVILDRHLLHVKNTLLQKFNIRVDLPSKVLLEISNFLNLDK